jgi:RimJ/RimL family protein N-acetyltransferase
LSDPEYRIEPWGADDLPLLERLLGDPAMTEYLGGPESPETIAKRHARYVTLPERGTGEMFTVVDTATSEAVGSVGYWDRDTPESLAYETGWAVLPEFHGRGIATIATAQLIELLRAARERRYLYAYPSVDNGPSNAICRKLGFEVVGMTEYEYPIDSGNILRCNDWRLELFSAD